MPTESVLACTETVLSTFFCPYYWHRPTGIFNGHLRLGLHGFPAIIFVSPTTLQKMSVRKRIVPEYQ